jgi:hypothetical protein
MDFHTDTPLPETAVVRQTLSRGAVDDVAGSTAAALDDLSFEAPTTPGKRVAVAVGSRGIRHLGTVVERCLQYLKELGLQPFILPAMGSHGGATPEGQRQVLEKYGISETRLQVPVDADMTAAEIGRLECGMPIYFARSALDADYVVVINRVKPHTKFRAPVESGLCKMLTIGLGKAVGAETFHRWAVSHSFGIIEQAAEVVLKKIPLLFGLALVEDGYGDLESVTAVGPETLIEADKTLLKKAAALMGRIPFDGIDILVIDQIGKDISGIGMDSNVTGRHRDIVGDFYTAPHVKRIFVRELSPASDGNANGIGLADVTTRRLVEAVDRLKTYKNSVTAISPEKAAIPIYFETDREALAVCAATAGLEQPADARLVRIKNTKSLEVLEVSRALEKKIAANPNLEQVTPWRTMEFDEQGNLSALSLKQGTESRE